MTKQTETTDSKPIHNLITDTQQPIINRRHFLKTAGATTIAGTSALSLVGCDDETGDLFKQYKQPSVAFLHGVASGDPLTDRVILWTRVTPRHSNRQIEVSWKIAKDKNFTQIVNHGKTTTSGKHDFTVKVDADKLQPNTTYFYQFTVGQQTSPIGQTKTLPIGDVSQIKFAVMSCSNYPAGFFHAYAEIAKRDDIDVALHLGDYIYEYGRTTIDEKGNETVSYASSRAKDLNREVEPANEATKIDDYRKRYAQYRLDKDLQALHAKIPMIAVWDDHEISNDTFKDGAENHQPTTEGKWDDRKMAAMTAYHEWLPTRSQGTVNKIYRSFDFGNLLSLHMLDTRVIARDESLDYKHMLNKDGSFNHDKLKQGLTDHSRTLIGSEQQNWLYQQLQKSTATWQILGQQVIMGRMWIPSPILLNFYDKSQGVSALGYVGLVSKFKNDPNSLTPEQLKIVQAPSIPYNLDAWDGYPANREMVLGMAKNLNKNLVVLAGDTHNAWANNLTNQNNEAVGVEFATSSISSPGLEEYLSSISPMLLSAGLPALVESKTLKWCETSKRGFMVLTVTPSHCQCEWVLLDSVFKPNYQANVAKTMFVKTNEPMLIDNL